MNVNQEYLDFLKKKIKTAENFGFELDPKRLNPILKPHQKDIVTWAVRGGRRAVFASFGLGKTIMQLEVGYQVHAETQKPVLFGLPLAVRHEFKKDADKLGYQVAYCRNAQEVQEALDKGVFLIMSNYERIRDGQLDMSVFGCVCLDEASVIRSMGTLTTQYILSNLSKIPFRFVFTATPSPNEYHELLKYSEFLGIMSISHALSRYFKRDAVKAHNSQLLEHREADFWLWVSTWATFIVKPSDLGYQDTGYDFPEMEIHWHRVKVEGRELKAQDNGQIMLTHDQVTGLSETSLEKRISLDERIEKAKSIVEANPGNWLIWHHREDERAMIQKEIPETVSVYGSQTEEEKEKYLMGFSDGKYKNLSTKPVIAGSGCNFQYYCHQAVFVGIDYKFNDFIQAIHRIYRFGQSQKVHLHIIYTDGEDRVRKELEAKWKRHRILVDQMTQIIRANKLTTNIIQDQKRKFMVERKEAKGQMWTAINADSCIEIANWKENSVDLIVSSIPFSDLFEYAESYNDMGQSLGDKEFFEHMDFLTPHLLRVLKPGRIACIHVKDVIKYSYQNGVGFPSLHRFSDKVADHFEKHGFWSMGRITVDTDVVSENNQTYRLGWSEMCKDGSKMGVGLPEYVLLFRKVPTDTSNAYADDTISNDKSTYTRARWQLNASHHWKSNGNRLLTEKELERLDLGPIMDWWRNYSLNNPYDFETHVELCEKLDQTGKLPVDFMALPPLSDKPHIWDDIQRINTLNSQQVRAKLIKHVCPLQLDLIERLIYRYSMEGELVLDPFGGIMSTPYVSVKMKRRGIAVELNDQSWRDGVRHLRAIEHKMNVPTLFDLAV